MIISVSPFCSRLNFYGIQRLSDGWIRVWKPSLWFFNSELLILHCALIYVGLGNSFNMLLLLPVIIGIIGNILPRFKVESLKGANSIQNATYNLWNEVSRSIAYTLFSGIIMLFSVLLPQELVFGFINININTHGYTAKFCKDKLIALSILVQRFFRYHICIQSPKVRFYTKEKAPAWWELLP